MQSGGIIRWRHLSSIFDQSQRSSQHSTIRPPPPPPPPQTPTVKEEDIVPIVIDTTTPSSPPPPPTTRKTTKTTTKRRRRQQRRRYVNRNNYFVFDNNSNNNKNNGLSMSSNVKAVTLLWIPRKMTEGPTRPLINMNGKKPSEYYLLRSETLQDRVMNAMFNHYGCGYDSLPPPLQRLYYDHIYKK